MANNPYVGEVRLFGFSFAPRGYVLAQGQVLSISQYTALFALYGTTYGGNGSSTFGIPDLRGRVAVGQGQRPGGNNYPIGAQTGSESTTLLTQNLPAHVHGFTGTINAIQTKGTDNAPDTGSLLARAIDGGGTGAVPQIYVPAGTTGTQVPLGGLSGTVAPTGSNLPVSVLQPLLALNYSIALQGIFPSRN